MRHVLTGDQQREFSRKLGEIQRQLGLDEYPFDPVQSMEALQVLQNIIEGRLNAVGKPFPCEVHARHLIPPDYRVLADVAPSEFQVKDLEFIHYMEPPQTPFERGRIRLRERFGLADIPRFLEQQDQIPERLRRSIIVFGGTLMAMPKGVLIIPTISWDLSGKKGWELVFHIPNGNHIGDFQPCFKEEAVDRN